MQKTMKSPSPKTRAMHRESGTVNDIICFGLDLGRLGYIVKFGDPPNPFSLMRTSKSLFCGFHLCPRAAQDRPFETR